MAEIEIYDIDVWGRRDANGAPIRHFTKKAFFQNMLEAWITASDSDYIRASHPNELDAIDFKLITPSNASYYTSIIQNSLSGFASFYGLSLVGTTMTFDEEHKEWALDVNFIINDSNEVATAQVNFRAVENNQDSRSSMYVYYTGTSLIGVVSTVVTENAGMPLIRDAESGFWSWGRYVFVNLREGTPTFDKVKAITEGSV